jgi:hypothetical protein
MLLMKKVMDAMHNVRLMCNQFALIKAEFRAIYLIVKTLYVENITILLNLQVFNNK